MPPDRRRRKNNAPAVRVVNRQRLVRLARPDLERVVAGVLKDEDVPGRLAVEVTVVRDRAIRPVNRDFLGKDRATDVLAFPYLRPRDWRAAETAAGDWADGAKALLGEVLVSADQAVAMARAGRVTVDRALVRLVVHGVLHLMGYDHEHSADAREMRRLERRHVERWRAAVRSKS